MQHKVRILGAHERSYVTRAGEKREVIDLNMALPCRTENGTEYTEEIVGSIAAKDGLIEKLSAYVKAGTLLLATFYMHTSESKVGGWFQQCQVKNLAEEV